MMAASYRKETKYSPGEEDRVCHSIAEDKMSSKDGEYMQFHDCWFVGSYNHSSSVQLPIYCGSLKIPMSWRERG